MAAATTGTAAITTTAAAAKIGKGTLNGVPCSVFLIRFESVPFLSPNKKGTKEVGTGEALKAVLPHSPVALPCEPHPTRTFDGAEHLNGQDQTAIQFPRRRGLRSPRPAGLRIFQTAQQQIREEAVSRFLSLFSYWSVGACSARPRATDGRPYLPMTGIRPGVERAQRCIKL